MFVMGSATTAACEVDSSSTLIGPFEAARERERPLNLTARAQIQWTNQSCGWSHLASGRCRGTHHKQLRKAQEANFMADFSLFTSLSTAKAHVFRVKFMGLYGTVGFIAIRNSSFWGESDLWSNVCPAMDGVVCLSIPLGGVMISNNFTKRHQNGFKLGTRDKFATHSREENFISHGIVIYTIFFAIGDFPIQFSIYTSCRVHHVFWVWGACDRRLLMRCDTALTAYLLVGTFWSLFYVFAKNERQRAFTQGKEARKVVVFFFSQFP